MADKGKPRKSARQDLKETIQQLKKPFGKRPPRAVGQGKPHKKPLTKKQKEAAARAKKRNSLKAKVARSVAGIGRRS